MMHSHSFSGHDLQCPLTSDGRAQAKDCTMQLSLLVLFTPHRNWRGPIDFSEDSWFILYIYGMVWVGRDLQII